MTKTLNADDGDSGDIAGNPMLFDKLVSLVSVSEQGQLPFNSPFPFGFVMTIVRHGRSLRPKDCLHPCYDSHVYIGVVRLAWGVSVKADGRVSCSRLGKGLGCRQ